MRSGTTSFLRGKYKVGADSLEHFNRAVEVAPSDCIYLNSFIIVFNFIFVVVRVS